MHDCNTSGCRGPLARRTAVGTVLFLLLTHGGTQAHEGHGTQEVGEYDLDAPRVLSAETAEHIGLKTAAVETGPLEEVLAITGVVRALPDRRNAIAPRVSGRVLEVMKQVGDTVRPGEVVARLDSPEFARSLYDARKLEVEYRQVQLQLTQRRAAAERLEAEIAVSRAALAYAEAERDRARSLEGQGVPRKEVALRELESVRASGEVKLKEIERRLALEEVESLEAQAKALLLSRDALLLVNNLEPGVDLEKVTGTVELRAEAGGVVVRRSAVPGRWAQAGEALLETADYAVVQVEGELPESLIPRVRARESDRVRVRVPSDPGFLAEGSVRFLAPELEPVKRTAHVIVDVPNPDGVLRGEMWVDLSIVLRERPGALVVPRTAVVVQGPMHFVFIQNGEAFQKQDIVPGWSDDRNVEVLRGLAPGDTIVIQGAYSLTQLRPKRGAK